MKQLKPIRDRLVSTLNIIIKEIQPGERFQVIIPRNYSHDEDEYDWQQLDLLQMAYRGSSLSDNVFATLRYDKYDQKGEVKMDICCL